MNSIKKRIARKDMPRVKSLINKLVSMRTPFWKKVAYELSKPKKERVTVNISKIERYADGKKRVLVPGKVLGSGRLSKAVEVYAFGYSDSAKHIIEMAGGSAKYIEALADEKKPKEVLLLK